MRGERRTAEQLREHYEIEKELAARLRTAPRQERHSLYSSLYDELFRRVPLHPQLTRKTSSSQRTGAVRSQMRFLGPFLNEGVTFLEVGPGDCALSLEVARSVKGVYAVDVSHEITKTLTVPENFRLLTSDGCSIPIPPESVHVAYSNQLMEHLHPDDALEQLRNIYAGLAPGGLYICFTPNRVTGPHDISKYFDAVATGFHLREYTILELYGLFRKVGFSKVEAYIGGKGFYARFPSISLLVLCERTLSALPSTLRKTIGQSAPFQALLNCRLVGRR